MSIYSNLLAKPKTVAEYDNEAQTAQMNRLALQDGQNKQAEYQRGVAGDALLSRTLASGGDVQNALASGGFGKQALAYAQQQIAQKKTAAETGHLDAQTGDLTQKTKVGTYDLERKKHDVALSEITSFNTPADALASLGAHIKKGEMSPEEGDAMRQSIPQDPAKFRQWQLQGVQSILSAKDRMEYLAPTANTVANNKTSVQTAGISAAASKYSADKSAATAGARLAFDKESAVNGDDAAMDPMAIRMTAQQYLAGDSGALSNFGRGAQGAKNLNAVRLEVAKQATAAGLNGADIAAKMAEFGGVKAGQRTAGTRSASIEIAASEAAELAPLAIEASRKVSRSGFLPFGKAQIMFDQNTNDPALRQFAMANTALSNAYSQVMSRGGVATVSDKEHARELLSTAHDQPSYEAAVAQMTREIQAAQKAPGAVKKAISSGVTGKGGHDAPTAIPAGWSVKEH